MLPEPVMIHVCIMCTHVGPIMTNANVAHISKGGGGAWRSKPNCAALHRQVGYVFAKWPVTGLHQRTIQFLAYDVVGASTCAVPVCVCVFACMHACVSIVHSLLGLRQSTNMIGICSKEGSLGLMEFLGCRWWTVEILLWLVYLETLEVLWTWRLWRRIGHLWRIQCGLRTTPSWVLLMLGSYLVNLWLFKSSVPHQRL